MAKRNVIREVPDDLAGRDLDDLLNLLPVSLRSHSRRVAVSASLMAGCMDAGIKPLDIPRGMDLPLIAHLGGTCHDIGKLLLPALLTAEADYLYHPALGAALLERHSKSLFDSEIQGKLVTETVRHHHERADGQGFPDGLPAADIPLLTGICAVADWLDHRLGAGRPGCRFSEETLREISGQAGALFCEGAVACLKRAWAILAEQYRGWGCVVEIE